MSGEAEGWDAEDDRRVVKMWEPLRFAVGSGYRFFPSSLAFRLAHRAFRLLARAVFSPVDRRFFRLKIEGEENLAFLRGGKVGCITVSNHVHYLDCIWVALSLRSHDLRFLSLAANFRIPLVRHLVRILGGFPLPETARQMARLNEELTRRVKKGGLAHVYPEGVLVPYCPSLRRFKRGAFLIAAEAGAPILPFVIVFRKADGPLRALRRRPCPTLLILPPVLPREGAEPKEESRRLMAEVWDRMRAAELASGKPNNLGSTRHGATC